MLISSVYCLLRCRCVCGSSRVLAQKSSLARSRYRIQVWPNCVIPGFLLCAGSKQKSKRTTKKSKTKAGKNMPDWIKSDFSLFLVLFEAFFCSFISSAFQLNELVREMSSGTHCRSWCSMQHTPLPNSKYKHIKYY